MFYNNNFLLKCFLDESFLIPIFLTNTKLEYAGFLSYAQTFLIILLKSNVTLLSISDETSEFLC